MFIFEIIGFCPIFQDFWKQINRMYSIYYPFLLITYHLSFPAKQIYLFTGIPATLYTQLLWMVNAPRVHARTLCVCLSISLYCSGGTYSLVMHSTNQAASLWDEKSIWWALNMAEILCTVEPASKSMCKHLVPKMSCCRGILCIFPHGGRSGWG